jgi:hypothetical protein
MWQEHEWEHSSTRENPHLPSGTGFSHVLTYILSGLALT